MFTFHFTYFPPGSQLPCLCFQSSLPPFPTTQSSSDTCSTSSPSVPQRLKVSAATRPHSTATTTRTVPVHSPSLPFPSITMVMGDLYTYLFGAESSASRSGPAFLSGKYIVLFVNLETLGSTRVITAPDSAIGASKSSSGYQPTVPWK